MSAYQLIHKLPLLDVLLLELMQVGIFHVELVIHLFDLGHVDGLLRLSLGVESLPPCGDLR